MVRPVTEADLCPNTRGVWKDRPRHDDSLHGADAFLTFACVGGGGRSSVDMLIAHLAFLAAFAFVAGLLAGLLRASNLLFLPDGMERHANICAQLLTIR